MVHMIWNQKQTLYDISAWRIHQISNSSFRGLIKRIFLATIPLTFALDSNRQGIREA